MKIFPKIFTFLFLSSGILTYSGVFAEDFLSQGLSFDLYQQIDEGYDEMQQKFLSRELKGADNAGASTHLNRILDSQIYADAGLKACFNEGGSAGEMEENIVKVATQKDIPTLLEMLSEDCQTKLEASCSGGGSCYGASGGTQIPFVAVETLTNAVTSFYTISKEAADTKIDQSYKISKIGLYADGIAENSPFDLMVDLGEINEMIFEKEIPYTGVNTIDSGNYLRNIFDGMSSKDAYENAMLPSYPWPEGSGKDPSSGSGAGDDSDVAPSVPENPSTSELICVDGKTWKNRSELNDSVFIDILTRNKPQPIPRDTRDWTNRISTSVLPGAGRGSHTFSSISDIESNYAKLNDNSVWPCTVYFCITIEFITNNYPLFAGGVDLTIEGLVRRSNAHLKKFAGTSLIQSNMTINNFQIGLKDLHLPDLFHVGVVVTHKPVPMLNLFDLKKEGREDFQEEDTKAKNLLENYYKNLGLDYKRQNDMSFFLTSEKERKDILDRVEHAMVSAEELHNQRLRYEHMLAQTNAYIDSMIEAKVLEDDVDEVYNRFIEIERFTYAMKEFTVNLNSIVKEMNKIPQGGPN